MLTLPNTIVQFELPKHLACPKPTEDRGIPRDAVRLLVTGHNGTSIQHRHFYQFADFFEEGDVLVVNTSATQAAALPITLPSGASGMLHFSTKLAHRKWLIEIREQRAAKTFRWKNGLEGMKIPLANGGYIQLQQRFYKNEQLLDLWIAEIHLPTGFSNYMKEHGQAIKYTNVDQPHPLSYYQTFFSFHPGSSEMPSAGRGFTASLVEKLLAKGVQFAPVLLHTGVSSLEEDEKPYPEYMEISPVSAAIINTAKEEGKRVIAVGTTGIRAVESAVNEGGKVIPFKGHTELFIEQDSQLQIADGLLTGFHEPKASHLHMLQALAGHEHLAKAYEAALAQDYYWHEFGDLHLILGD